MKLVYTLALLSIFSSWSMAQGRKMPPFSFQEHSTTFANANRSYSQGSGFTTADTLSDAMILASLAKILELNPALHIELVGHTAMNEDVRLGLERAAYVRTLLIEKNVGQTRLFIVNEGHNLPLLSDEIIMALPSKIEKDAANERNRRVEVRVVETKAE